MLETENEKLAQQFVQTVAASMRSPIHKDTMDIVRGETGALLCLYQHPEGLSSGKMGEILGISSGGVANLLKTLEAKSMLTRNFSEQDRRCVLVQLTDHGTEYAEAQYKALEKKLIRFVEHSGRDKIRHFLEITEQIIHCEESLDA